MCCCSSSTLLIAAGQRGLVLALICSVLDHIFGYRKGKKEVMGMLQGTVPGYGLRHQGINASIFINDKDEVAALSFLNVAQVTDGSFGLQPPVILGHSVVTDESNFRDTVRETEIK